MKTVQGFEFEDHYEFNETAIYLLACLRRNKFIQFEMDDAPENYEAMKQLMLVNNEHFTILEKNSHYFVIFMHNHHKVKM